jgi:hypothetical protein
MTPRGLAFLLALLGFGVHTAQAADPPKPVKVFILAGQSNMEGQAVADLEGKDYNGGKGTLKALLNDPAKAPLVKHLVNDKGGWAVREDVWVRYQREKQPLLAGKLSVGFAVYGGTHHFGPELQFGHVVGDHFSEQVLLIKTAWGGKSLYKDFRPPSSGGEVGPYYTKMIAEVREALANLKKDFPADADQGYELAGFVWYHGWNDGVEPKKAVPEYEQNLVNLIKDVRKEFKAPNLPVVVGELTGPWVDAPGEWATLRKAQAAAAARPEFRGNVLFASTRDFVRPAKESPNPGHGHHEFGNAETYFLVGDALGKGMVKLLTQPKEKPEPPKKAEPAKPTSYTNKQIEGWTIRVDDRLLKAPNDELGTRALKFLENKLSDIKVVVPADKVKKLQAVTIVLDLTHGNLGPMQYHPDAGWLKANGYSADLARCVHLPRAADVATKRNIREQPWVILHELAHAYHDQVLGFEEPRVKEVFEKYKKSGHGEKTLLYDGRRVKHYALTNHKEFFAEMTEAYFGSNDFFPFNRAELKESEPEIYELMVNIWESPARQEVPPKKTFKVGDSTAFVIMPKVFDAKKPIPWVWYAPTFPGLPEARENWMFEKFLAAGIAIAGVDVGESYGSPKGREIYSALYKELTTNRNFAAKPVLLARSRGGLMLYNWAAENPDKVAGIAGIYPVCDLRSYPGLEKACGAYGLTRAELEAQLEKHNPVDRLAPLAKAGVPIFHIHGDTDAVVPLKDNSAEVAKRYEKLGGKMELKVAKGQGHNYWEGFFQCQELVDFVLARCAPAKEPKKAPAPDKP